MAKGGFAHRLSCFAANATKVTLGLTGGARTNFCKPANSSICAIDFALPRRTGGGNRRRHQLLLLPPPTGGALAHRHTHTHNCELRRADSALSRVARAHWRRNSIVALNHSRLFRSSRSFVSSSFARSLKFNN
jgi:hypothetical protein